MNKEGSSATDLRDILALPLVANRGCWLMLAMPGTANDNLKSIAK